MRILTVHADWLEVEPKTKAIAGAEHAERTKQRWEDCLVVFMAVEGRDEPAIERVAEKTGDEIIAVAKEVKAKTIVLYPYVHLTSSPAGAASAHKALVDVQTFLRQRGYDATHAPFGWYKAFDLKCKGHPLSELSREIFAEPGEGATSKQEDAVSGALKAEEKVRSEWFILTAEGELVPVDNFDFGQHRNLEKFKNYEIAKVRSVAEEPPHARLMRALQLVDYEPGSDPGNLRYYPKGRTIKALLEQWISAKMLKYGAMEVETPVMYDYEHPALENYLNRFPARQYTLQSAKKRFFLRFSACFGQFLMSANANISYRDLPMKMYELTRYSFRLEKAGELVGLRRLRSFTMPDMHTMCADMKGAKEEFVKQFKLGMECMADIGLDRSEYEMAFRCTQDFWACNRDWVIELVKMFGKPALVEMWNTRFAYFDPKFEFNFVDSMSKASALSTVQIDHENAQRFGIKYTDADNSRKHPLILHCSPSGALERVMYALLEKAHMDSQKQKPPSLPLWLAPVQVRLCPLSDDYIPDCAKMAEALKDCARVDIDDRAETVQRKVRDAELEWVPYILVVGERERKGDLSVRVRETGKLERMSLDDLKTEIKRKTEGKPFRPIGLPMLLSARSSWGA
ncbi:MAG: threonine--tRNA ligase [Candidatus Aenigmatarchaeota archaeon]